MVLGQLGPRGQGGELRVYSGANRLHETMLLDTPSGLAVFRQTEEGKVPALAVACGEWLYVFKSMKPHMNFRVPATDAEEAEREAWAAARASEVGEAGVGAGAAIIETGCSFHFLSLSLLPQYFFPSLPLFFTHLERRVEASRNAQAAAKGLGSPHANVAGIPG